MTYTIREMKPHEYPLLLHFLYEAIFVPDGMNPPPKTIVYRPELQVYVTAFGKKDDACLVAEVDGAVVGAVWVRIMNDYGHVDETTPSFAISIDEGYRGRGIGTAMMKAMLCLLQKKGYQQASLSVQKANAAVTMYQTVGFEIMEETAEEYRMICRLSQINDPLISEKRWEQR